jgi:hypothetical protein
VGTVASGFANDTIWEIVFLMLVLKIPIAYLCWIVWWAIKSEPKPQDGAPVTAAIGPQDGPGGLRRRPRGLRPRPHGGPSRTYPRTARSSLARAEARRR